MYWEEAGNASGVPVVFLHGGPGAGSTPDHRRFFDPRFYRIIVFDQRGAGRSLPHGEIEDNTTPLLVADMERLRRHLGVERWVVFGGSWGSTLALAYGAAHPERCLAFVLRGIFLGSWDEIDWFLYGLRRFFPEAWRAFVRDIPQAEREDLLQAYLNRLVHPDPQVHLPAARASGSMAMSRSMMGSADVPLSMMSPVTTSTRLPPAHVAGALWVMRPAEVRRWYATSASPWKSPTASIASTPLIITTAGCAAQSR